MTDPAPQQESDLAALLHQAKQSGLELHRFWRAPKATQQDRYERILLAAIETAREEGYEAVQMRSIAKRSDASLATVYTYFTSRDYLVFCAMVAWASLAKWRAHHETEERPGSQETHLVAAWTRMSQIWRGEQRLLETWVRSTLTQDTRVAESLRSIDWAYWTTDVRDLDITDELRNHMVLANEIFFAGAVHWAFGQADLDTVIDRTLEFIRRPLEAAAHQV
jgi:AcrR family transcriptional regulator